MTAILTQRCDPYGVERERYGEKLAGGMFPHAKAGAYIWHCENAVSGRYKFRCTGGDYGFSLANDGGLIEAYHCDGGHEGLVMPLCDVHRREMAAGPPPPGWSKDGKNSYGQIGGSKANEMCPRCAAPEVARAYMDEADWIQQEMSKIKYMENATGLLISSAEFKRLEQRQNDARAKLDELHQRGIVHKCPLRLVEVS